MPTNSAQKYCTAVKEDCNGKPQVIVCMNSSVPDEARQRVSLDSNEKHADGQVHYHSNSATARRKWTNREKYLLSLCCLLFAASVVFIFIAFFRDSLLSKNSEYHMHYNR